MFDNLSDFCVHVLPGIKNYLLRIQYLAAIRIIAPGALARGRLATLHNSLSLFSPPGGRHPEPSGDNGRRYDTPVLIGLFVGPRHAVIDNFFATFGRNMPGRFYVIVRSTEMLTPQSVTDGLTMADSPLRMRRL